MANDKRRFYCLPRRAIGDGELTALDHRVLGAIAIHDGMSATKGNGIGCVASYNTLKDAVDCNYTNLSKSITKLIRKGYLLREPQVLDKRKYTLRVVYDASPDSWRDDQQSTAENVGGMTNDPNEIVGEITNDRRKVVGQTTTQTLKIVGQADLQTPENVQENGHYYIPLNGESDSVETGKKITPKGRDVLSRHDVNVNDEDSGVHGPLGSGLNRTRR